MKEEEGGKKRGKEDAIKLEALRQTLRDPSPLKYKESAGNRVRLLLLSTSLLASILSSKRYREKDIPMCCCLFLGFSSSFFCLIYSHQESPPP